LRKHARYSYEGGFLDPVFRISARFSAKENVNVERANTAELLDPDVGYVLTLARKIGRSGYGTRVESGSFLVPCIWAVELVYFENEGGSIIAVEIKVYELGVCVPEGRGGPDTI
jgi:hypothetical protein